MWLWFIVHSLSCVWLFATPWTAAFQASLSFTISQGLLKLMSTEMVMPSNHLILPLSPASLPALSLSQHQGLFQWVASSHQVAKVLEFQLQQQSFQWLFRVDFLYDWLVWSCYPKDPQESSPAPQVKSINSLVLSLLYGPTLNICTLLLEKPIALTRWTFVGKVMSLLFNTYLGLS